MSSAYADGPSELLSQPADRATNTPKSNDRPTASCASEQGVLNMKTKGNEFVGICKRHFCGCGTQQQIVDDG